MKEQTYKTTHTHTELKNSTSLPTKPNSLFLPDLFAFLPFGKKEGWEKIAKNLEKEAQ